MNHKSYAVYVAILTVAMAGPLFAGPATANHGRAITYHGYHNDSMTCTLTLHGVRLSATTWEFSAWATGTACPIATPGLCDLTGSIEAGFSSPSPVCNFAVGPAHAWGTGWVQVDWLRMGPYFAPWADGYYA